MGKLRDAARGLVQSNSIQGKKRDAVWKTIFAVAMVGLLCLLQLVILEHRWYSSSSELRDLSSLPRVVSFEEETMDKYSSSEPTGNSSSPESSGNSSSLESTGNSSTMVNPNSSSQSGGRPPPVQHKDPPGKSENTKNDKLSGFKPENTFLPMKDVDMPGNTRSDTNWFMSGLRGKSTSKRNGETFDLPMDDPEGRVLCVRGNDLHDGTKNGYGLFQKAAIPQNAFFRQGTTFIADNYWGYDNIWHSMSALVNFGTWHMDNKCSSPDRLLLYHKGELVTSMSSWITHVLQAAFLKNLPIETGLSGANSTLCFERAVIQRRGLGGVAVTYIRVLFDMLRCKARRYCGIRRPARKPSSIEVLILARTGHRAFANETGVAAVVHNECSKVPGCITRMLHAGNLTFCEQVEMMSRADVLISVHGAQLTNMMFMSPGSRLMEMFPKGWQELAGVGQDIYRWEASWSRVIHAGRWRDPEGPDCPYPATETSKCFSFFKDRDVGLNATHLAEWTRTVLSDFGATEHTGEDWDDVRNGLCACDADDGVV